MSNDWLRDYAQTYFGRIIYAEAPPATSTRCADCDIGLPTFTCQDCLHNALLCQPCLLHRHAVLPTHRFRKWNRQCFTSVSARSLEYTLNLGHNGKPCNLGDTWSFTLGDSTGLHEFTVRFCQHSGHPTQVQQLLDAQIFPCSNKQPQTGFTFAVLRKFHLFATEAKLSAQRFYNVLVYSSHTFAPDEAPDRYREFLRASRQWDYLQDLRCSGQSNMGILASSPGDLALRCPACPREHVNFLARDVTPQNL
jgi:hypothetical protein